MLNGWRRNGTRFQFVTRTDGETLRDGTSMRAPYGLEIIENCLACPHREERLFCNLPEASVKALSTITSSASYPKGATLFVEGQPARGVFILCSGRVKLSTSSADGKTLILRISEPGEVLGLPATVTGTCYELTGDVIEPAQANFISRNEFLNFLKENGKQHFGWRNNWVKRTTQRWPRCARSGCRTRPEKSWRGSCWSGRRTIRRKKAKCESS